MASEAPPIYECALAELLAEGVAEDVMLNGVDGRGALHGTDVRTRAVCARSENLVRVTCSRLSIEH